MPLGANLKARGDEAVPVMPCRPLRGAYHPEPVAEVLDLEEIEDEEVDDPFFEGGYGTFNIYIANARPRLPARTRQPRNVTHSR